MDGRNPGDDRIAALEKKVDSLSKGPPAWWKDKVLVAVLGMVLPVTALAIQRLDSASKGKLDDSRQTFERKMQLARDYADREAFAIKMTADAKLPEDKTRVLELLNVLAAPVKESPAPGQSPDADEGGEAKDQWLRLITALTEQLATAAVRGEFRDETDIDQALAAMNRTDEILRNRLPPSHVEKADSEKNAEPGQTQPAPSSDPRTQATGVLLTTVQTATTILADKSVRRNALANRGAGAGIKVTPPQVRRVIVALKSAQATTVRSGLLLGVQGNVQRNVVEQIAKSVARAHLSQVRACYRQELTSGAPGAGALKATVVIAAKGEVQNVSVVDNKLNNPAVANCVKAEIKSWDFPASTPLSTVDYVFDFGVAD